MGKASHHYRPGDDRSGSLGLPTIHTLDQTLTRSVGYLPYFYVAPQLAFHHAVNLGAALVVSMAFSVACMGVSRGLTHWQHHSASMACPVRTWSTAAAILAVVPAVEAFFLVLITPDLQVAASGAGAALAYLKGLAILVPPFLIFLGFQTSTRTCPYVARRLKRKNGGAHTSGPAVIHQSQIIR